MAIDAFAAEVMADGPIGYWRLGEPLGSGTAADSAGNNTGHVSGGVTFGQPGFQGGDTAALFDGATGRIIAPSSNSLNPPHITMEAKVRWDGPDPSGQTFQRILEKSAWPGGDTAQYALMIKPDGHARVELRTTLPPPSSPSWENVDLVSTNPVLQGVETHIVATYDGSHIRLYLNGHKDSEKSVTPGTIVPPASGTGSQYADQIGVGIGNQTERPRPFNGLIDEVALYPRALSEDRIPAHYQSQFAVIFQYAAKFVCGKSPGKVVAPGVYFTAVNVHNPTYTKVRFRVKIAVAWPALKPGPVSKFHDAELGPDEALEIDCPDIVRLAHADVGFLKGFVVIETEVELDVVAVYTAAGRDEQVETLHTERVPARARKRGR